MQPVAKKSSLLQTLSNIFFPIKRQELKHFVPLAVLMFCILLNQNILRVLKDSVVITEVNVEIINFIKLYCVTPIAPIFLIIYSKMVNVMPLERIYYYLLAFFCTLLFLFAFVIYPNIHYFHFDESYIAEFSENNPRLKWYMLIAGNWSFVMFYVLGELWPNIFYVLLFWQCANSFTSTNQAKRFYTLFSLFGNSSLILVGLIIMNLASGSSVLKKYFGDSQDKIILTQALVLIIIISALLSAFVMRYIASNLLSKHVSAKDRPKLGLRESLTYISKSRYLWLLLICSASFGLVINLVEVVWKDKAKQLYPDMNSFAEFSGMYIFWTGIAITALTIIGNNIMRIYSWFASAIITPLIIMITGIMFFALVVFDNFSSSFTNTVIFSSPIALCVLIGTIQNVLAKSAKYSIWDTSREMLYIPLDVELKTKGKAAVDVISAKVGKSLASLIQIIIFTIMPYATYSSISPILMVIFAIFCVLWINSISEISQKYTVLLEQQEKNK
ncbi:MAG: NTP/NDP exchange transporter [Rickettsiaceae bacterium]|nr:NTP/NDP exchange transporter [Rickettsiaceae bacterium]